MKTAYITHRDCILHDMGSCHPESPDRLRALNSHLAKTGLLGFLQQVTAKPATREQLERVHTAAHLDFLKARNPLLGYAEIDGDTLLCPDSLRAAALAAGAVVQAVDGIFAGDFQRAFCAVRPPGHHAEAALAMGFCFYNNVAVGVRHAMVRYGVARAAVLDFDVHHGNGTVDIFKDDPAVLVCSSFQHPFYPGRYVDIERPNIVNTWLAAGDGGEQFRALVGEQWRPALKAHQPQLIFVSAGFDAHEDDPLAEINLHEEDFGWVTDLIVEAANEFAQGRVIATLEGGYDLAALARSVYIHLTQLNKHFYKAG